MIESWTESARRWERAKRSLGGGVSTGLRATMKPHPLFFERGQGSRLWDVDGNEYADFVLGWGPVILGHSHPALIRAVSEQLARGQTFGSGHAAEYEVAEQVCAAYPGAQRVLWSNTGTEAVQVAIRLARAATGRTRIVKFEGHYHGWSDSMLLGYRPDPGGRLDGLGSRGQHPNSADDIVLLPWGDLDSLSAVLAEDSADIAAVLTEPVLCNSGVIAAPAGFLAGLRQLCDRTGTTLIFDEVITGFRIAYGGAAERFGVQPDLAVFAKALAGGFSLAAIAGRADLIDQVTSGVVHAGTYNGNPIALAAASATLTELARPGVYERFDQLGQRLADGMAEAFSRHGITAAVNHIGPVVQCAPGVDRLDGFSDFCAADWSSYDEITVELLRRGVFALPGGRWYLSTAHTEVDIDHAVQALGEALSAA